MFGIVRKYKGLEFAIKAMKHLNLYSNYQLLVVGEVWINPIIAKSIRNFYKVIY